MTAPGAVEYPRRCPSTEPENTTPGMAVTAADWAGEQLVRSAAHGDGLPLQTILPVFKSMPCRPPPLFGSRTERKPRGRGGSGLVPMPISEMATKTFCPSDAEPH